MPKESPQDAPVKDVRATLTDELIPSDLRNAFNSKLRPHQKETVNFLILRYNEYMRNLDNPDIRSTQQEQKKLNGFIVGHEMGLGKTVMVLFFLRCVVKHPHPAMRPQRIIIVVSKTLISQWRQEINQWCQAVPLYTYHGTRQERTRKLMDARNERVCIILTTYALLGNDGEHIMSVLKDGNTLYSSFSPTISSDSSIDNSLDSAPSKPPVSAASDAISNDDLESADQADQGSSDSSSFIDPISEFSWMVKRQSKSARENAASVAAHRLERLSLQTSSEPALKRESASTAHSTAQTQIVCTTSKQDSSNTPENLMYLPPPPSSQLPKHCIDILIMDEATAIKNTATKASRGLKCIDAGFKLAMTGTPVMNNLGELWAIVDYINPGYFGDRAQFDKHIAKPINNGELQDASARERYVAQKVRRALKAKLRPILIRRTTADLGSLGVNKITITFWIPLTEAQFILYGSALRMKSTLDVYRNSSYYTRIIHLLHLLFKICDNPCELSTEDASFFGGNLEKAFLNIRQKATQPQTRDSDYLQVLEDLKISKLADQSASQHDFRHLDKSGIGAATATNNTILGTSQPGGMTALNALDTFEQDHINEKDSTDTDLDAQDWMVTQSFEEYTHKSPDHYDFTVRSITALSNKYALFMEIINHIKKNNHRVLIFCSYQIVFSMIEHLLAHNDIPYLRLDGTVSDISERNRICKAFNTNKRYIAFLISIKLGSMGLNITGANRVILFAPAWSLQVEEQAIARAYRMGQTRNVVVYKLACINTIEEKMVVRQLQKASIANVTLNDEKHQSVIRKTDLDNLFEFNSNGRLEGQLPENIKQHATQAHVRLTIQQTLGSARCNDEQTEADKELEFVNSLLTKDFCTDVSVLDYLHSKANIDEEADIPEQASSQAGESNYDKILSVGPEEPPKPEESKSRSENCAWLVSIYIESYRLDYLRSIIKVIFVHCNIDMSSYDNLLFNYFRRRRESILNMNRNGINIHTQVSRPFVPLANPKNANYITEWQNYFSWAVLMASMNITDIDIFPQELHHFKITSHEQITCVMHDPEFQTKYNYFNLQLKSIISHFAIEIMKALIVEQSDILDICCTSTVDEYNIYLHNLVITRIQLLMRNSNLFGINLTFPATLDIVCSLCRYNHLPLETLIAECDNPQNWISPRAKAMPQAAKEKKKIPLLWGPMEEEFAKVQKATITSLIQRVYGQINYAILDKCSFSPVPSNLARQTTDGNISPRDITICFEKEIDTAQTNESFSKIRQQYVLMDNDMKEIILRDTHQKLCHYLSLLPPGTQRAIPVRINNPIIPPASGRAVHSAPQPVPVPVPVPQPAHQHTYKTDPPVNAGRQLQAEEQHTSSNRGDYEDDDDDSIDILA